MTTWDVRRKPPPTGLRRKPSKPQEGGICPKLPGRCLREFRTVVPWGDPGGLKVCIGGKYWGAAIGFVVAIIFGFIVGITASNSSDPEDLMPLLLVGGLGSLVVAGVAAAGMAEERKVAHGFSAVGALFVANLLVGVVCNV